MASGDRLTAPLDPFVPKNTILHDFNLGSALIKSATRMESLETVVADRASRRQANVDHRERALKAVVSGAMEPIRSSDGKRRSSRLDSREQPMTIHNPVAQQNFLSAAASHIERRKIV
jgi:hypothetical protein